MVLKKGFLVMSWLAGLAGPRPAPGRVARVGGRPAYLAAQPRPGQGRQLRVLPGLRARQAGPGRAEAGLPAALPARISTDRPAWPGSGRAPCTQKKLPNGSIIGEAYLYPSTYLQPF